MLTKHEIFELEALQNHLFESFYFTDKKIEAQLFKLSRPYIKFYFFFHSRRFFIIWRLTEISLKLELIKWQTYKDT